jgi:acetylornithine/succinyldiaminopimelate/putrescine aminotransferase/predicted amino acid dehydrogenase
MNDSRPIAVNAIESALDLPHEWEALRRVEQVALDPRVLRAFEAARIPGVETIFTTVSSGGHVVAGAAMHKVEILLERQRLEWIKTMVRMAKDTDRADLLRFRALMCGLNISQGRDDVVSGNAPPSPNVVQALAEWAEETAARDDLDGIIFGHLHNDRCPPFDVLREMDYVRLPSLGYATLPVTWKSLDQYIGQLRAGHRRQVLASLSRRRKAGLEVFPDLDLYSHAEEFSRLYLAVLERAEQRIETLNHAFFSKVAETCRQHAGLVGINQGGRLVAGAVTMRAGDRLCCIDVGIDYEVQTQSDLYINLLLALIERAGMTGAKHLDLGQTALAAKANLGARIEPTWLFVRARSPLVHASLRVERSDLVPPSLPERHVFRTRRLERSSQPIEVMQRFDAAGGEWARHVNPDLASYLALLRMDRVYIRGEGHRLWDTDGREVFDAAAGYGALPFGHNPEWLWDEVIKLARRHAPHFVQGALGAESGELAALLCRHAPESIRYCVFANSGAEAVEVAIKAARAATGRPKIIVAEGAFHGKTLGALSATASQWYREPFFAPVPGFVRIRYGDIDDLEKALEEHRGSIAAFLVEPVQGEAGVIIPPQGYLQAAGEICTSHDVLLLVDEVQTGLGRLGSLFACAEEGLRPDAIMLSKALGGGLVPASACLLSERAWSEKLAMRHSSTFAGGTLAAAIGFAVVKKLLENGGELLAKVKRSGEEWQQRLKAIAAEGMAITEVRGRGLLLGLEIGPLDHVNSPVLRSLACDGKLIPLICGYLLNSHGLRVMPPLARKSTLRLLPPLNATPDLLDHTSTAMADVVMRLNHGDLQGMTSYLLGRSVSRSPEQSGYRMPHSASGEPQPLIAGTFAFITTALDNESYRQLEPSLRKSSDIEIANYERIVRDTAEIVHLSEVVLRSRTGAYCRGWFLGLPFTSKGLLSLPPEDAVRWVQRGVSKARSLGAKIVGLGALTSVVTKGGMTLRDEGVGITTGNSYTVAAAMESIRLAARRLGINPRDETCAVIGAAGSIGSVCARLCAEFAGRVILVGKPNGGKVAERLSRLACQIVEETSSGTDVRWTTDIEAAVAAARLVICATSAPYPVLDPGWLCPGTIVCDVAQPRDLGPDAREKRNDVLLMDGGVVELPEPVSLGWNFGFDSGTVYACMAETISLAFDGWRGHYALSPHEITYSWRDAAERAERHGFRVAAVRSFGLPLSEEEIARVRRNIAR